MCETEVKGKEFLFWKYIDSFVSALESEGIERDIEAISNAAYVGVRAIGLEIPDDFQPKGTAGVTSPTVLWELYAVRNRDGVKGRKIDTSLPQYARAYEIGAKLAKYTNEEMCITALFLKYDGKYIAPSDIKSAKRVLNDICSTPGHR